MYSVYDAAAESEAGVAGGPTLKFKQESQCGVSDWTPLKRVGSEVQADCMCTVYLCVPVCYRGRRCKLTVYV